VTVLLYARRKVTARASALGVALVLVGCTTLGPGRGSALSWSELPGWSSASLATAWPALLNSCQKLATVEEWRSVCLDAAAMPAPDEDGARAFFEARFEPRLQRAGWFRSTGLVTGYYEPLLHGNWTRTDRYRYPLYRPPEDLVSVELGALYPELKNKRVRGRLTGRRVVPYFSRTEIDSTRAPLAGNELLWVDDPVALFFLQIQGSGRVRLPSGEMLSVGYADQNGYAYTAIGRTVAERAGFKLEDIDLPTIRTWLADHPLDAHAVMNANASYVFFALRDSSLPGPLGALGVPLLPERAVAVDPAYVPLGVPVWLDTNLPGEEKPYRQLVFAQDTGGAIKGPVRADLFFGYGASAEGYAGRMRSPGKLYVLLPVRSSIKSQTDR
jgi:membrane-bound lytic murein transglycosylase A